MLHHRLQIVGVIALVGGSIACGTVPKSTGIRYSYDCPVGPRVFRVTNSGTESTDLFLSTGLASGGSISRFIGSVAPGKTEMFVLERGSVQTRDNTLGEPNQSMNRPSTLRYEFFCTAADTVR
jgi:hypothetical protein